MVSFLQSLNTESASVVVPSGMVTCVTWAANGFTILRLIVVVAAEKVRWCWPVNMACCVGAGFFFCSGFWGDFFRGVGLVWIFLNLNRVLQCHNRAVPKATRAEGMPTDIRMLRAKIFIPAATKILCSHASAYGKVKQAPIVQPVISTKRRMLVTGEV